MSLANPLRYVVQIDKSTRKFTISQFGHIKAARQAALAFHKSTKGFLTGFEIRRGKAGREHFDFHREREIYILDIKIVYIYMHVCDMHFVDSLVRTHSMCSNQSFYAYTVRAGAQRLASGERAGFEGEDSGRTEILPGTAVFQ